MPPIVRRLVVAGAIVLVVCLVWAVVVRGDMERRAADRAVASAAEQSTATPSASSSAPVVSVVSDERSIAAQGAETVPPWPLLVGRSTGADMVSLSSGGSGYTVRPSSSLFGGTFVAKAQQVATDSVAVVFFGGSHDAGEPRLDVVDAATRAFNAAKARAPEADVIVVGPITSAELPSSGLLQVRDDLRSAARLADVRFVDPIRAGWLSDGTDLFGDDGASLTEAGQKALAARMQPLIAQSLP